ncbi:MAG: hypothetical protein ACI8Y4_000638 [Candidatus Poriferisodalaceae bacterium]|jgi:hypothetical protein
MVNTFARAELPIEELADRLRSRAAVLASETAMFLVLLAEFDRREGWAGDGIRSCAHWMNIHLGTNRRTAREQLRVARSLEVLPKTTAAFESGVLSYSRVRAMTRNALPETEEQLLEVAQVSTGQQLEKIIATQRILDNNLLPTPPAPPPSLARRDNGRGQTVITLTIDSADAELLWKAVHAATVPDRERGLSERRADAAVAIADSYLAHGPLDRSGADRTQIVMHTRQDSDEASLSDGSAIDLATKCRLECEASHITFTVDLEDPLVEVPGRRSSGVSERLRRQLLLRDRTCRWPGCVAEYHLHAHHVRFRSEGGPTVLENLVLLCGHHHRVLHREGFGISGSHADGWVFHRADSTVLDGRPHLQAVPRNRPPTEPPPPETMISNWNGDRLDPDNIAWIPIKRAS